MPRRRGPVRRVAARRKGQRKLNQRQKTQVKRLIGRRTEQKIADTTIATTNIDANGAMLQLNHPAQGDAYNERAGDEILLQKLSWRLNLICADATNFIRMIIFRWNVNDAALTPGATDVLEALNASAFPEYQNTLQAKIHIIHDRTYGLSTAAFPNRILLGSLYGKKLGRKKLGFNQGLTTGQDHVYFMFISDSVAASHPTVSGTIRLDYTDG